MDLNAIINEFFNDPFRLQRKIEKLSTHRGTTYISMLDRYEKAIGWMQEKEIKIHPSSRIMKYKSIFSENVKKIANGDSPLEILDDKYTKATIHDAYKFIDCIESIKASNAIDIKVIDAFTKAVNGPFCYTEEKGDNAKARNYLFELETSAQFYSKTSNFNFGENEQGDINPLLKTETGTYRLMVECKRIQSHNSIGSNIKEAIKQANLRISNQPRDLSYAYICLDVTKLVNSENEISVCKNDTEYFDAAEKHSRDLERLAMSISPFMDEIHEKNESLLAVSFHSFCLMMKQDFEIPTGVPTQLVAVRKFLNPEQNLIIQEVNRALSNRDLHI